MGNFFGHLRNKVRFCGSRYVLEPTYKLFYVSEDSENILTCKVPENVLEIKMHRPFGADIFGRNVIGLSKGDIFKIRVRNFKISPKMSILEKSAAITYHYIRYNGNGEFEEIKVSTMPQIDETPYITVYNGLY